MSAMKVFDHVHENGGKIVSFLSYCGGLPAPEDNNNPLGYKFSWAPRGVLLASRNSALFLQDGKEVTIPGKDLFANYKIDTVEGLGEFECYPNRNSIQYLDIYPLKGECKTIIRGTYRNRGWCDAIKALADLDYLNTDARDLTGLTYADLTRSLSGSKAIGVVALQDAVAKKIGLAIDAPQIKIMNWLDLFSERLIPQSRSSTALDALCASMLSKMGYADGERDMLVMKHTFVAEFPEKKKRQTITSKMIDFGLKNGDSSMSRTVSLPVAIVTRLVLEGKYSHLKGLQLPLAKEFYTPILTELAEMGIHFVEKIEKEEAL
jgi:saccharopine dehydrogenase-like NADP-dependent oxidoreductase